MRERNVMLRGVWLAVVTSAVCVVAHADAVVRLQNFASQVKQGQASFTQTVTSPDGKKVRKSSGTLAFAKPSRFRFEYLKPMPQVIVGDGKQVWLYDPDLKQVTVRPMTEAMGATPAALLAGGSIERDFVLKNLPSVEAPGSSSANGAALEWVQALPKVKDGAFQSVKVGFKGDQLVAIEVLDGFGQLSRLDFSPFDRQSALLADRFTFTPPPGVDVLKQP